MSTVTRARKSTTRNTVNNTKANNSVKVEKIENCVVVETDDELRDKSNGKQYGLVRVKFTSKKTGKEMEVLAMQTGEVTVEEGDLVNIYHRSYVDKNGVKRHGFDLQPITGLASTEELDEEFD